MRMRNKYRKPTTFRCYAGSRCSTSAVVWSLVGCLLMFHLYSLVHQKDGMGRDIQFRASVHPQLHELEKVEEESIRMPPPRKRSPRAAKRKPKRPTTIIDEFLDENSQIRHIFFPDQKLAIDPLKDAGNDSYYYYPGRIWLDTEGNPIQAHGGGILYDEKSGTYYWYGEYKDGPTYHAHKKGAAGRSGRSRRNSSPHQEQLSFCLYKLVVSPRIRRCITVIITADHHTTEEVREVREVREVQEVREVREAALNMVMVIKELREEGMEDQEEAATEDQEEEEEATEGQEEEEEEEEATEGQEEEEEEEEDTEDQEEEDMEDQEEEDTEDMVVTDHGARLRILLVVYLAS